MGRHLGLRRPKGNSNEFHMLNVALFSVIHSRCLLSSWMQSLPLSVPLSQPSRNHTGFLSRSFRESQSAPQSWPQLAFQSIAPAPQLMPRSIPQSPYSCPSRHPLDALVDTSVSAPTHSSIGKRSHQCKTPFVQGPIGTKRHRCKAYQRIGARPHRCNAPSAHRPSRSGQRPLAVP